MKPILRLVGALCALAFFTNPVQAAPSSAGQSGVQLTVELRDGSRVVGKSLEDTLSLHSAALGDMKLPWAGVRSIEYAGTNAATARLTTTNGDGFAIQFAADTLRMETGFGQTELPVRLIRSVKVAPPAKPSAAAGSDTARLTIELRDGSHVVGKSLEDGLSFHTSAMGDLKLTWAGIRSIEYAGTNTEMARLTATNGDVYEVQFAISSLGVETSFGKTELPVKLIRSVKVSMVVQPGQMPSGLVARWTGDGNAQDSAGHFDGHVSGGLRYVPGPAGHAFEFNGGGARVDFGATAGNFGTNDFTVAFWMKTDSRIRHGAFLAKRASCDAMGSYWDIQTGSGVNPPNPPAGFLVFGFGAGGNRPTYPLLSLHPVNDGQWHHVAWVRQSTASGSILGQVYLDGALDNSISYPETVDISNQTPLVLGHDVCECCDGTQPYSGAAAELQLFSQALSADEVITLYQSGKSGN